MKIYLPGSGERVQWMQHFLGKLEDQGVMLQTCLKPEQVQCLPVLPTCRRQRQESWNW